MPKAWIPIAVAVTLGLAACSASPRVPEGPREVQVHPPDGRALPVTVLRPARRGPWPAILVLEDGGLGRNKGRILRALADRGWAVVALRAAGTGAGTGAGAGTGTRTRTGAETGAGTGAGAGAGAAADAHLVAARVAELVSCWNGRLVVLGFGAGAALAAEVAAGAPGAVAVAVVAGSVPVAALAELSLPAFVAHGGRDPETPPAATAALVALERPGLVVRRYGPLDGRLRDRHGRPGLHRVARDLLPFLRAAARPTAATPSTP